MPMLYLAIETSCDDTSIALLYNPNQTGGDILTRINQTQILGEIVSSQIKVHEQYGGVVPEIGARLHANAIHFLLEDVLIQSITTLKSNTNLANKLNINCESIQAPKELLKYINKICVTTEPGLPSALRVGLEFAKTLKFFVKSQYDTDLEIKKINHLRGHIASSWFFIAAKHKTKLQEQAQ